MKQNQFYNSPTDLGYQGKSRNPTGCFSKTTLFIMLICLLAVAIFSQDRQYTLKGTTEQMVALRIALEQSTAPYKDVIKVQEWLIPQLIQQDQAFAKADSVKAKGAK